jgi:hypothetical protein
MLIYFDLNFDILFLHFYIKNAREFSLHRTLNLIQFFLPERFQYLKSANKSRYFPGSGLKPEAAKQIPF